MKMPGKRHMAADSLNKSRLRVSNKDITLLTIALIASGVVVATIALQYTNLTA